MTKYVKLEDVLKPLQGDGYSGYKAEYLKQYYEKLPVYEVEKKLFKINFTIYESGFGNVQKMAYVYANSSKEAELTLKKAYHKLYIEINIEVFEEVNKNTLITSDRNGEWKW